MQILFLTTILPRKQRMGSEVASQCLIDALCQAGHQVLIVGYMRQDDPFAPAPTEVLVGRRYIETQRAKWYPPLWMLLSFIRNLPYSGVKYYSQAYINQLDTLLTHSFDLVVIDHPQLAWLQPLLPLNQKLVMIAHNVEHQIYRHHAAAGHPLMRWIYRREARLIQRLEDHLATAADQIWALSEQDAKYFARFGTAKTVSLARLPAQSPVQVLPQTKLFDIGLIGSWAWKPNEEGLRWFLEQVLPHLPTDLSIHVAGRGADWLTAQYPQIHYCGFVPDAQVFMAQAKAVAIATLSGSGIQIKTLDALASGSRIVATPIALRGLENLPPTVHVAHRPKPFAEALLAAIQANSWSADPRTWRQPDSDIAAQWCQDRQKHFLAEIAENLKSLQGETK